MLPSQDGKPSDDILILCDYLVWGFSFRSKQWLQYHVDDLIDVNFNSRSFDRLVLREDYKTILKAMVVQHFTQGQNIFRDLVAGKGQGLNILLQGLIALNQVSAYRLRLSRSARSRQDLKHLSKDDRRVLARHARDDWSHKDFNGRQIRNAVKTALTLARQDGAEVQVRHFQIVLDIGMFAFARVMAPTRRIWVARC